jgi:hypothetical protein
VFRAAFDSKFRIEVLKQATAPEKEQPKSEMQQGTSRVASATQSLSRLDKAVVFFTKRSTGGRALAVVAITAMQKHLTQWLSKQEAPMETVAATIID